MSIRNAAPEDICRIAEILVFNNRLNYFPIFKDEDYSFNTMQVFPIAQSILKDSSFFSETYVLEEDGILRGFVRVRENEILKLYVDPCFQGRGYGNRLLSYAVNACNASFLWVLEKNTRAAAFYRRCGFVPTSEKVFEEGTDEYLIKMVRQCKVQPQSP